MIKYTISSLIIFALSVIGFDFLMVSTKSFFKGSVGQKERERKNRVPISDLILLVDLY